MTQSIQPIRIPNTECRVCGKLRRNDGLKCPHCDSYQHEDVGMPITGDRSSYAWLKYETRRANEEEIISRRRRLISSLQ